ncbi:hypothetical protein BJ508DRAFT_334547 [Ascobolus immersus RN42]|uniref:Uncharacterized protein n=1 Tax=Ascobolus immersus RN42 TaxID=1160509 RepID=A0A3N4HFP0_ASCIM|nr:hypothetical protein BJ508DRAFT_334547 [Ascobolus immersus RN42]
MGSYKEFMFHHLLDYSLIDEFKFEETFCGYDVLQCYVKLDKILSELVEAGRETAGAARDFFCKQLEEWVNAKVAVARLGNAALFEVRSDDKLLTHSDAYYVSNEASVWVTPKIEEWMRRTSSEYLAQLNVLRTAADQTLIPSTTATAPSTSAKATPAIATAALATASTNPQCSKGGWWSANHASPAQLSFTDGELRQRIANDGTEVGVQYKGCNYLGCQRYGNKFTSYAEAQKHANEAHGNRRPVICGEELDRGGICYAESSSRGNWLDHRKTFSAHTKIADEPARL